MAVSDRWLRSFVAAVEAGSFSAAARRLGVGQPAISHAVGRLERELGVTLVERGQRQLSLTNAGRSLYEEARVGFARIDAAVQALEFGGDSPVVTLSVSTSLANFWLLPRLPEFKRRHPEIDLRVITTDTDAGVGVDDADLWIPLGPVERPDLDAELFRSERIVPVASPGMAERLGENPSAEDLLTAPLLHLEERYRSRYDWRRWFADQGVAVPGTLPGYRTNDYSLILQSALEGQGVALGWEHIIELLLASGRLTALSNPVETEQAFLVRYRSAERRRAEVERFLSWLVGRDGPDT